MTNHVTLIFNCAATHEAINACIEYSWVSTGQRHVIRVPSGGVIGVRTDQHSDVTHVQVYSLRNGNYGQEQTANGWQFPPGPPPAGKYLIGAVVQVAGSEAHGCGLYNDGTASAIDVLSLDPVKPFECGESMA
jgi:hypothetical protein